MKKLCLTLVLALALLALPGLAEEDDAPEERVSGDWYYVVHEDGSAEITYWTGGAATLTVPSVLDGHRVTALGDHALAYWEELEQVRLPDGLARIGDGAFEGCACLRAIDLPAVVSQIGANPFKACGALKEIGTGGGHLTFEDGMLLDRKGGRLVSFLPASGITAAAVPEGKIGRAHV